MLQCQRREALREGMTSFDKLKIGEADLLPSALSPPFREVTIWAS